MRIARITAFAALILLSSQAVANHHVRAYVAPYIPGADRAAFLNAFIILTNQQPVSAPISIKAYLNRDSTAQSCGSLPDLAPYEIRRYLRNAGTLCVARDESADSSLRIRTVEGVHVSGFLVLAADRNRMLIPMEIDSVEPEGPAGITFSRLTLQGLANGGYRLSIALRSSSGTWPYPLQACVQVRSADPRDTYLHNRPTRNCSLPNEQTRGWTAPGGLGGGTRDSIIGIVTQRGSHTSAVASADYDYYNPGTPPTYRVCIHRDSGDVVPAPFLCDTVTYSP